MSEKDSINPELKNGYELAFHIVPSYDEAEASKVFDAIFKLVEDKGGKVVNKSLPALVNLIYTMERTADSVKSKYNQAYFAWIIFESEDVEQVKAGLDTNTEILRYLLVKTDQSDGVKSYEVKAMLGGEEDSEEEAREEAKQEKAQKEDENTEEKPEETNNSAVESKVSDKVDEAIEELVK